MLPSYDFSFMFRSATFGLGYSWDPRSSWIGASGSPACLWVIDSPTYDLPTTPRLEPSQAAGPSTTAALDIPLPSPPVTLGTPFPSENADNPQAPVSPTQSVVQRRGLRPMADMILGRWDHVPA